MPSELQRIYDKHGTGDKGRVRIDVASLENVQFVNKARKTKAKGAALEREARRRAEEHPDVDHNQTVLPAMQSWVTEKKPGGVVAEYLEKHPQKKTKHKEMAEKRRKEKAARFDRGGARRAREVPVWRIKLDAQILRLVRIANHVPALARILKLEYKSFEDEGLDEPKIAGFLRTTGVTCKDVYALRRVFNLIDVDRSGTIDYAEFFEFLGVKPTAFTDNMYATYTYFDVRRQFLQRSNSSQPAL
jgi:hypothetical protein